MPDNHSIVESRLFKSISPHVTSISREKLFLAFRGLKVQKIEVDWSTGDLGPAFSWDMDDEMGDMFWSDLNEEIRRHQRMPHDEVIEVDMD